jgi:broad specificity phosphatase PhoE
MSLSLPRLFVTRHGDTDWTDSRQHTGRTDLPLNARGEQRARELRDRLHQFNFAQIFTSPLQRASKTCELVGYGPAAKVDDNLVEWDYGRYEGKRTDEILAERPDWELFRDGCPGGESPEQVAARADRFVARAREFGGDVLAFSSGHIIRMIAARWLGLPPAAGRFFFCRPASVGVLWFEHNDRTQPIIGAWNFVEELRQHET